MASLLILALFILAALLTGSPFSHAGETTTHPASADLHPLERIATDFKISIITANPTFPVKITHGTIDGRSAELHDIHNYAGLFASEFGIYPPELVSRSKLKQVVFCRELSFAGQRRNAIPDFQNNTLYLDIARGTDSKTYLRKVIHHEFFHIIDYRDDGSVYRDDQWAALNPPDFKYGTGGRNAQHMRDTSVLTNTLPGFLDHYATTGVEEDKAEVFANLIVDGEYIKERIPQDTILGNKVRRMKAQLEIFCPEVNASFWERVGSVKRNNQ
ncbi:MAG: hypothetical protein C0478_05060 [Planctomyces sp.]|nr:hypothetical protein [Planctomyces sp.]